MDLWNIKDLEPPPVLSCKITTKEIDIRLLDILLKNGVDFFENQQPLYIEAALLSRTVYRLKMKFRNSKDFKSVEKLCRVLRVYLQIDIYALLKKLSQSIPQNYKVSKTYTLNKNMVDYVLVRIQGLGKTLCRILETCKIVSTLMQQRLRLGHFWKVAVVIFASASRIFVITKSILKYVCELYLNLLPFSSSLNNSGVQWLPEDYSFPSRLDEWLNIDWIDLDNTVIEIEDDDPNLSYFKLADSDDDVEFCDEYILVKDESVIGEDGSQKGDSDIEVKSEADIGEVVNDTEIANDESPKRKKRKKTGNKNFTIDIGEVINVSDVVNDASRKRKKRKKAGNKNLTDDIGEVINVSDVVNESDVIDITDETPISKKRKRKSKILQNSAEKRKVIHSNRVQRRLRKKRKQSAFKSGNFAEGLNRINSPKNQKRKRKSLKQHFTRLQKTKGGKLSR